MKKQKKSWKQLVAEIEEKKKDPQFIRAVREFIKLTTS